MDLANFSDGRGICFYSDRIDGDAGSGYVGHELSLGSSLYVSIRDLIGLRSGFKVLKASQCHSNIVVEASTSWCDSPRADGIVSTVSALIPTVMVADCVPIGLYSKHGGIAAAVHAGWRGLTAGVVENAVDLIKRVSGASDIEAVVGPHICPNCYEFIGPESEEIVKTFGEDCFVGASCNYLDLSVCVEKIFDTKGVTKIFEEKDCTLCSGRFFSYRGGDTTQRIVLGVGVVGE